MLTLRLMEKVGIAELPLHGGKCPRWLFSRMVPLARSIVEIIIREYGSVELLRRLSDPFWFQAFGNVLGFDWHSSGLTTTVCGALKEAVNRDEDLPIKIAGGKGKVSLSTPEQIKVLASSMNIPDWKLDTLVYASRMSAKVDNAAVQDSYQLYHHVIAFDERGRWCVIQQGMNEASGYARRYHWLHSKASTSFVDEPHTAICTQKKENSVLDMTSGKNAEVRRACVDLVNDEIKKLKKWMVMVAPNNLLRYARPLRNCVEGKKEGDGWKKGSISTKLLRMPANHFRIPLQKSSIALLERISDQSPENFEEILQVRGVGPATVRALALTAQLIYGTEISWKDPAKFSFAHGGKDGVPYPVNRKRMETTVKLLEDAIKNAELGKKDKLLALKRLADWCEHIESSADAGKIGVCKSSEI